MNTEFVKNFSLEGKRALILGGSKGIGRTCSQFLSNQGASIFAVARGEQGLSTLVKSLPTLDNSYLAVDLSKDESIERLIEAITRWGIPDVIVANLYIRTPSEKLSVLKENSTELILEDLKYLFHLFPICIPQQRKNQFGRWIGISSMTASLGGYGQAAYSIKKTALESVIKTLAIEEGRFGITANTVSPGIILTTGTNDNYPQDLISTFSKMNVIGRAGTCEEVAHAVSFLASPLASYITGVNIPVCAGYNLGWGIQYATQGKLKL
ncbi:MAG: SDR family oxidoreductase [Leptospiraceae bacterium]|nr:SDR family oxidoreductase [Leptospiraceae bacterium]